MGSFLKRVLSSSRIISLTLKFRKRKDFLFITVPTHTLILLESFASLACTLGLLRWSSGKESTCQCRRHKRLGTQSGSVSGVGRSPGEEMATHSSILTWRIPWTEEPGGLQSIGPQKSWTQLNTDTHTCLCLNQSLWPEEMGNVDGSGMIHSFPYSGQALKLAHWPQALLSKEEGMDAEQEQTAKQHTFPLLKPITWYRILIKYSLSHHHYLNWAQIFKM